MADGPRLSRWLGLGNRWSAACITSCTRLSLCMVPRASGRYGTRYGIQDRSRNPFSSIKI